MLMAIVFVLNADRFGGVLGLLPAFKHMDSSAALLSIGAGFLTFVLTRYIVQVSLAAEIGLPVMVAFIVYCLVGVITRGSNAKKTRNGTSSSIH